MSESSLTQSSNTPTATRVLSPEHFSSEPDNTALYIPKGRERDHRTSNMPRFTIPAQIYGPVRNHAVVALTTSANIVDRRRSLTQLRTMAANGDEQAIVVLEALQGLTLE